jgi:predicted porin
MKKTLVAAAALVSVSAFAQVTITGNLDFAGANISGSQYGAKGQTISTTIGVSSTSVINLDAIEDIGGGSKVQVHYGLDPRSLANDAFTVTNNQVNTTTANAPVSTTVTGLSRDELYIAFDSASAGKLMLGAPNSLGLDTHGVASPLGTGIGSGYAPAASTMTNAVVTTRYNRSVRFNSAVMSGFSVQANYAPGSDVQGTVSGAASGVGAGVANVALVFPNARKATEFGLSYANGPLNARFTNVTLAAQTYAAGYYANNGDGSITAANLVAAKSNLFSVNYNIGATTLYYGYTNGDLQTSTTTATKGISTRVAAKYDAGVFAVIAQRTALRSTTSANVITDSTVTGLRADYPLSKTSKVYAGYEYWNTGAAATTTSTTTGDKKLTSIGLQKSF